MQTLSKFKKEIFISRPGVKKEYDKLGPKFKLIAKTLRARNRQKLTQKQVADLMGTKQSALARFEAGNSNPTLSFLQRLAKALNTSFVLRIS
ncbi:helix-turn-helix transcriptional regulator [Candidatus Shapirobacteria bacterium]|nr:helix-turn-helix transcriptional regulator [Candidatus Shapirobacteria bacterium]